MNRKGIYYSMDAVLSGLLLVGVAVALLHLSFYEPDLEQETYLTQDLLSVLSVIEVNEINHPFVLAEIASGNISNINNTVLEQAGEYWALNETWKAKLLLQIVMNETLPESISVELNIENESLFMENNTNQNNIIPARRMISGIAKGEPIAGFSSSAYLKKVRNKKTASYAYFGGYYGQGNITVTVDLPSDFNPSRLITADIKIETGGTFNLFINGTQCGGSYTGTEQNVTSWDVLNCNTSFQSGTNNITLQYTSTLNKSAVSGGFLKLTYTTDSLTEATPPGYKRHYFPSIEGFINIYDSVAVQGDLKNYTINLTLFNAYDTFFTFGNETIFIEPGDNTTKKNIVYSRFNQTLPLYDIPVRIGTTNLSNITIIQDGEPADTFLVTDVSWSMNDCGEYYDRDVLYCRYEWRSWTGNWWWIECEYPGSCSGSECNWFGNPPTRNHFTYNKTETDCNRSLMELAQAADHLYVDVVLGNSTLNKIGLVDYSNNANNPTPLSNNAGALHAEIDTYAPDSNTCTCCGINRAKDQLLTSSAKRFMIVLSDGEPTLGCDDFFDYTGANEGSAAEQQDAIDAGQNACNNHNITVYTIGFGEGMSATGHNVMRQTACNDSLYYNATNVSQLMEIYANISDRVRLDANYSSQTISIVGNFTRAYLYNNSYVDLEYYPIYGNETQSKLAITFESNQFNGCNATIDLPEGIQIQDAHVTSFSGNHWTKQLTVNNIEVFNLTSYKSPYVLLGDPFVIQVPAVFLKPGQPNNFSLVVGDNATHTAACSPNNTLIYTALINSSTPRTSTYERFEGCNWTIESEAGSNSTLLIPAGYNKTKRCNYTSASMSYDVLDAYDMATYHLLKQLDPDGNGKVLVDITESDLEITITLVSGVPYLWGPSVVHAKVWTE